MKTGAGAPRVGATRSVSLTRDKETAATSPTSARWSTPASSS